jgi:hypothetical protein
MKVITLLLLGFLVPVNAIPNAVLGAIREEKSEFDGVDLSKQLLADAWVDGAKLPGDWNEEGTVETATISHLMARPKIFGQDVSLVRAVHRAGAMESLEITFVDAGSYFGYYQMEKEAAKNLSPKEQQLVMQKELAGKQQEFTTLYETSLAAVREGIAKYAHDQPKMVKIGKTRALRAEVEQWKMDKHSLRLLADGKRLIRLTVYAASNPPDDWMDASCEKLDAREKSNKLSEKVTKRNDGTVELATLRSIPQGYQPYCGLNTLAMAARHYGLHVDEDWLAVAGGFQNTGSAAGSDILGLYDAIASEAGLHMNRQSKLTVGDVQRAIDQGLPVIVWRRFSPERNQLHSDFISDLQKDPSATLPDPQTDSERASWPDQKAPLHASVIVGYHAQRGEFLFLESWTGNDHPRRMRTAEMEATAYFTFVFEK